MHAVFGRVHFACVGFIIAWTCWLCKWHYHQYVVIRQHYMKMGEDVGVLSV